MSIIVDGYNYIGRSREFDLSDPEARNKLIYLIGQYCSKVHKSATIVLDGNYFVDLANRKRHYGRVTVIYTSPIYTADEMIRKMIGTQSQKHRNALLIVSSDEDILGYARSHGVSVMRAEDFERTIEQALASPSEVDRAHVRISSEEVQEWLKVFEDRQTEQSKVKHSGNIRKRIPSIAMKMPETPRDRSGEEVPASNKPYNPKQHPQRRKTIVDSAPEDDAERVNIHLSPEEVQEWLHIFQANAKPRKKKSTSSA